MIGLMGDAKNTGQLIVNSSEAPAEMGEPHNSDMGLLSATDEIMSAFDKRDREALKMALQSFVKMTLYKSEKKEEQKPEMEKMESGGWT